MFFDTSCVIAYYLKAPDALHLAAASIENIPLITADRQLARNAETLGIRVVAK